MRILGIANNYRQNIKQNGTVNPAPVCCPPETDTVSFSGTKQNILSRIIGLFKKPIIEEVKPLNKELFIPHLKKIKKSPTFQIYSEKGQLLHNQGREDLNLSEEILKKAKNRVIVTSSSEKMDLESLIDLWEESPQGIIHLNLKGKNAQFFDFSPPTQSLRAIKKVLCGEIINEINSRAQAESLQRAISSRQPAYVRGAAFYDSVTKEYYSTVLRKLGIKESHVNI